MSNTKATTVSYESWVISAIGWTLLVGLACIFVTHDIGAAVEVADRIAVMYAGRIVEEGSARDLIHAPRHPYTMALLNSRAHGSMERGRPLDTIPGSPPDLAALPPGWLSAQ